MALTFNKDISLADLAILVGALGYFILPTDGVPDFIPVIGYVDDSAAIIAVFKVLSKYVSLSSSDKAQKKLDEIFKDKDNAELIARILEESRKKKK